MAHNRSPVMGLSAFRSGPRTSLCASVVSGASVLDRALGAGVWPSFAGIQERGA